MSLERHTALDARIRHALRDDPTVTHALAYGSFTQGTADRFSDLEYWAFLAPGEHLDVRAWLERLTPVLCMVVNEFGTPNAILPGLLRVELHAVPNARLSEIADWPGEHLNPARMLVKDQGGELESLLSGLSLKRPDPYAEAPLLLARTLNWLTFGLNVLARGERLRALELLGWGQRTLLRLACLESGHTAFWLNPARLAERWLPASVLARAARVTADLHGLEAAYAEAVAWTLELAGRLRLEVNPDLARELRERVGGSDGP